MQEALNPHCAASMAPNSRQPVLENCLANEPIEHSAANEWDFFSPSGVRGGDDRRQNNYIMNLLHLKHRVSQFRELGILAMRKALRGIKWSFKRYRGKTFIVYTIKKTQFKSDLETQFLTHLFRLLYSIILHLDHKALAFDRRPPLSFSFSPPREKCVGTPLLVHSY